MTRILIRAGAAALLLAAGGASAHAQPTGQPPAGPPGAEDPWSEPPQAAPDAPRRGPPGRRGPRIFVSPAGEVYRPGPGGRPFADWFRRADADGDGAIGWDEFRADFARVFATFDTDGDGEVEPEEVTRYETELLPEMSSTFGFGRRGGSGGRGRGGGGAPPDGSSDPGRAGGGGETGALPTSGRRRPAYSASMTGAARFGLLPIPHPIMEADLNFNRGVTRDEWERAARRRFTALDSAHNGRLTPMSLLEGRMAAMGGGSGGREERRRDPRRPRVDPGAGGTPLPRD